MRRGGRFRRHGRLVKVMEEWSTDQGKLESMGRAARALFEDRFERRRAVEAYVKSFEKCMSTVSAQPENCAAHPAKQDPNAEVNP